jgi:hypothetical protein
MIRDRVVPGRIRARRVASQAAMTVSPDPVHPAPLVRVARPRRRVVHPILWLAALGGLVGTLELTRSGSDCAAVADTAPAAIAARVCEREYARTGEPATGARLAEAHRGAGDLTTASAIARGLVATSARGDALRVLGEIALTQRRLPAALAAFENARALHQLDGQRAELSRDDAAIARAQRALLQRPPAAPP